jgi:hypothetical protein
MVASTSGSSRKFQRSVARFRIWRQVCRVEARMFSSRKRIPAHLPLAVSSRWPGGSLPPPAPPPKWYKPSNRPTKSPSRGAKPPLFTLSGYSHGDDLDQERFDPAAVDSLKAPNADFSRQWCALPQVLAHGQPILRPWGREIRHSPGQPWMAHHRGGKSCTPLIHPLCFWALINNSRLNQRTL